MPYGFTPALRNEYRQWLVAFSVKNPKLVAARARQIVPLIPHYKAVALATGVPAVWIAATMERESSSQLNTYLGNGDRVIGSAAMASGRRTWDVPRNRGPFPTWDAGAIDALHLDGMDKVAALPGGWFPEMSVYQWEKWNGFGYRNHGRRTPYVVAGTSLQQPGRYAGDGNWAANQMDTQMGTLEIALALIALDPSLDLTPSLAHFGEVSGDENKLPPTTPTPIEFVPGTMLWVQHALNDNLKLTDPLREDGIYGVRTKRAIMEFQREHPPLDVDGIAGPATQEILKEAA